MKHLQIACLSYYGHSSTAPQYVTDMLQKSDHTTITLSDSEDDYFNLYTLISVLRVPLESIHAVRMATLCTVLRVP